MIKTLKPLDPAVHPMHTEYSGPTEGWFICIHHESPLVEYSRDIRERVKLYNDGRKPESEIPARSAAMMWIDVEQFPGLEAWREAWTAYVEAGKAWYNDHPHEVAAIIQLLADQGVTWVRGYGIDFKKYNEENKEG